MFCQKCGAEMAAPARPCAKCGYQRHGAGWLIGKIIKAALLAVGVIAVGGMLAIYTGAKKGISGNAAQAQLAATPIQHFRDIGPETIVVAPRQVESIAVTVSGAMQATRIIGAFRAEGGGNDIRALILGGDGWINFMNGNQFKDYYDSGDVTVDRFDAGPLRAGTYRIAFSNTAILTNKVVTVAARVVWYQ